MDYFDVYVLTRLKIDEDGNVTAENVDVTADIHEAEEHKEKGVEHDYDTFKLAANWQEDAARSELVIAMRGFREIVEDMQREALK